MAVAKNDVAAARGVHDRCREAESMEVRGACDHAIEPLHLQGLTPAAEPGFLEQLQHLIPARAANVENRSAAA